MLTQPKWWFVFLLPYCGVGCYTPILEPESCNLQVITGHDIQNTGRGLAARNLCYGRCLHTAQSSADTIFSAEILFSCVTSGEAAGLRAVNCYAYPRLRQPRVRVRVRGTSRIQI